MLSPQQAIFMQQQGMGASRGPFSQQGPGGVLQGPLAYLEKTTSNIGKYKIHVSYMSLEAESLAKCEVSGAITIINIER